MRVSVGSVHNLQQWAAQQARAINREQDLSGIRVGPRDEIFPGSQSVLTGVDADSTYRYLLAGEQHRDGDIRGMHLLEASRQGLAPDYTMPMPAGACAPGNRPPGARHALPWRCVPHPAPVRNAGQRAGQPRQGARTRREKLEARTDRARVRGGVRAASLQR